MEFTFYRYLCCVISKFNRGITLTLILFCVNLKAAPKEKDSDGEEEKEKKSKEGKQVKDEKVPKKEEIKSTGEQVLEV